MDKKNLDLLYNYTLVEPFKFAKANNYSRSRMFTYPDKEEWLNYVLQFNLWKITEVEIPTATAIKETQSAITRLEKTLNKHYKKKKLGGGIVSNLTGPMYFDHLHQELDATKTLMHKWKEARKKMSRQKPSRYSSGLISTVASMIKFWNQHTGNKGRINAHNLGDSYEIKEATIKPSKNKNLKEIDVSYNPAGAFIQRTLDVYFNIELNNTELQRVLNKVYKSKS